MNELQIFSNPEFGDVRTIETEGQIWFCGKDSALALGYANTQKAIKDHCKTPRGNDLFGRGTDRDKSRWNTSVAESRNEIH